MNYSQIMDEIKHWNSSDKWSLLELLLRDLRLEDDMATLSQQRTSVEERLRIARELHGFIKPIHGPVPTDDDVKQIIREERFGKYA